MQATTRLLRSSLLRAPLATTNATSSSSIPSSPSASSSSRFPISHIRTFSYSPTTWAKEAHSSNPFEDGPTQFQQEHLPLFERIMQHPSVMSSIERMAKLTQSKTGINLQAGDKPSLSMMYTLSRDPELRSAAEDLMKSLKEAGIEVDPKEAFKALSMMGDETLRSFGEGAKFHEGVNKGGKGEGEDGEGGKK
ncbi:Dpc13p [Sporobolomyces salmoneus]|uniref:Dpc13p n=1 Tax=Sporobolomyces salmoneus TaxID=183962 RepID=UPI00316B4D0A